MMTLSKALTEYAFVTDNDALTALCEQWQHCSVLALDTEFIRVDTFNPRLGLIQVCDGKNNYLLDPLAITQWSAFAAILDNPRVLKTLHSCSEDLVVFRGFFGKVPTPLFDTQRAAAFLGFGYSISYQNLVKEVLGLEVSKDQTRSDWLRRPLSAEQLAYAALDVACMPQITGFLQEKLASTERSHWAALEFEQMVVGASADSGETEWNQYYQSLGMSWRLDALQLGTLQRLCAWRERVAREKDKPRSWTPCLGGRCAEDSRLVQTIDAQVCKRCAGNNCSSPFRGTVATVGHRPTADTVDARPAEALSGNSRECGANAWHRTGSPRPQEAIAAVAGKFGCSWQTRVATGYAGMASAIA